MPPAELLEELRSRQPFLEDFPSEWVPNNEAIYIIGSVVQAVLECLEAHSEPPGSVAKRLWAIYNYSYRYLSQLVIQILMESRRLGIRTTHVNALVGWCSMVVTTLLDHFNGRRTVSTSWLRHDNISEDGHFSSPMASTYEEMQYSGLSEALGLIIGYMSKHRTTIGTQSIHDNDRVDAAMDYIACLAEVSYIFWVIQKRELSGKLQEKILYIKWVLEELLEQSMSFFDGVWHLSAGGEDLDFVDRFLCQADDICMAIFCFLQTPCNSLDEETAFNISIDETFLPEYLSN